MILRLHAEENIVKYKLHVQNRAKSLFHLASNAVASPLQKTALQDPLALHQHELELIERTRFPACKDIHFNQITLNCSLVKDNKPGLVGKSGTSAGAFDMLKTAVPTKMAFSGLKAAPFGIFFSS